jgi:hypothetical protein
MAVDQYGNVAVDSALIDGVHDDGSSDGIVRQKLSQGGLVRLPLRPGQYQATTFGGATVTASTAGYLYNEDGSGQIVVLTSPSGLGEGCAVAMNFYGRQLGVRWYRQRTSVPTFEVVVDGVAYAVNSTTSNINNLQPSGTQSDEECLYLVVDDLPETYPDGTPIVHTVSVQLPAQLVSSASLYLFGFLVDGRIGYSEKPRVLVPLVASQVPSTAGQPTSGPSTDQSYRSVRKIMYCNTDTGNAHRVTIQIADNGGTFQTVKVLYLSASGTNGDSEEFDPGDRMLLGNNFKHVADAASVVNYCLIAGY